MTPFDLVLLELAEARAVMLSGTTDPDAAFPPERYTAEAAQYDVEAAVLRKWRPRLEQRTEHPSVIAEIPMPGSLQAPNGATAKSLSLSISRQAVDDETP